MPALAPFGRVGHVFVVTGGSDFGEESVTARLLRDRVTRSLAAMVVQKLALEMLIPAWCIVE
jgi:hypothetical protein